MIFLHFDSPLKTFVCNPAFCQDKVYSAFSGSGAKFSTSAFFMFPKPFVQIFCPADVVLRRTSRTYRLFKVQKIHVSCHESLPFLNVVKDVCGCRRNKLVSPASFNYQSIVSSQFLLLPLLLPLLLSLLLRLLLS